LVSDVSPTYRLFAGGAENKVGLSRNLFEDAYQFILALPERIFDCRRSREVEPAGSFIIKIGGI